LKINAFVAIFLVAIFCV